MDQSNRGRSHNRRGKKRSDTEDRKLKASREKK